VNFVIGLLSVCFHPIAFDPKRTFNVPLEAPKGVHPTSDRYWQLEVKTGKSLTI
jgi:hypothetical protein